MFTTHLLRSWVASAVAGAVLLGIAAPPASAQTSRRGPYSVFSLLKKKETATALKLTDEQQKKIEECAKNEQLPMDQLRAFLKRIGEARSNDAKAKIREEIGDAKRKQVEKAETDALAVLTPEQKTQFTTLRYRTAGASALLFDEVATKLDIKDDQKKKIEGLQKERFAAWFKVPFGDRNKESVKEKFKSEWDGKVFAVLTPAQRDDWKKLTGDGADTKKTDGPKTAKKDVPTQPAPTPTRTIRRAAGPYVASFDAPKGKAGSTTKRPATSYGKGPIDTGEKRFLSFNFENAPWKIVLEFFAKKAGLTLDVTKLPPDTFNYRDPDNLFTITEALDIMNGYLIGKNFILIRNNKLLSVRSLAEPIPQSMIPDVDAEVLAKRGNNELMRVTFKIKADVDIKTTTTDVEGLISPNPNFAKAIGFAAAQRIIVTDIGKNLKRVSELLSNLIEIPKNDDLAFKAFECKHVSAVDAAKILTEQLDAARNKTNVSSGAGGTAASNSDSNDPRARFRAMFAGRFGGGGTGGRGSRGGSRGTTGRGSTTRQTTGNAAVRVTADRRTNNVLVLATARQVKLAEGIIKAIDIEVSGNPNQISDANRPYFKVYRVYNIDPTEATRTLSVLMPENVINDQAIEGTLQQQQPSRFGRTRTTTTTVKKGGNIHTIGTAAEHEMLERLIREMDGGPGGTGGIVSKTIKLVGLDAVTVGNVVIQMHQNDGSTAPSVSGTGQLLFVRGTTAQVKEIEEFVKGWEAQTKPSFGDQVGNTRIFNVPDPEALARLIKQLSGNKIRIVNPNRTSPVRDRRTPNGNLRNPTDDNGRTTDGKDRSLWRNSPYYRRTTRARTRVPKISNDALAMATPDEQRRADGRGAFSTSSVATKEEDANNGSEPSAAANANAPVTMTYINGRIILTSDNKEELDKAQQLIEKLVPLIPTQNRWDVYYLKAADCSDAALMLEQLFPASSVSSATTANSGGVFGGLTSGVTQFTNTLGTMSGLNQLAGDTLRIIPEPRSNALFISGPSSKVRDVENMLKVLDATDLPGTLRDRVPRVIAPRYADVDDVATNIRELFGDYLQPTGGNRGNQANALAMLMNASQGRSSRGGRGGGGRNGGRSGGGARQQPAQLTLSVDHRTGQLLVACNDTLYQQIEQVVYDLDVSAALAQRTTRVVYLENAQPSAVTQALTAMYPNITVSVTSNRPGTSSSSTPGSSNGQSGNNGADRAARALMFQQMMRGQQGGGNNGGGGRFGGGRGGATFTPFGGGGGGRFGGGGGGGRFGGGGRGGGRGGRGR